MVELFGKSGDPDLTLCSAESSLGLHCLPVTLLGVSRLQWVKERSAEDFMRGIYNDGYVIFYFFFKAYVVVTHLICLSNVEAVQMSTDNIYYYKEVDKSAWAVI